MPEISRFFGMVITMYYNDHEPPHFHVRYGEQKALLSISELKVLQGTLSPRALNLVLQWAEAHRAELEVNWQLTVAKQPLLPIPPLE